MKKVQLLICFFLLINFWSFKAQTLTINDSVNPSELIEDYLIESNCSIISGISLTNDGSIDGIQSYGSFSASDNHNFGLSSGIVLTTGAAANAGNSNANDIGSVNWTGSSLYENALGLGNGSTFNSTEIEFTFKALENNIAFDYVLASEEWVGVNVCNSNEGVVILIKEEGQADSEYQNIAVLPGTSTPVTVGNIHNAQGTECNALNEELLIGTRSGSNIYPNYSRYTDTLEAQTNSEIGKEYTIKVIIADELNRAFDSAVFINTEDINTPTDFLAVNTTDMETVPVSGGNLSTCAASIILSLEENFPTTYTYKWFKDNLELAETSSSLDVVDSGTYKIEVYTDNAACFSEESIVVDLSVSETGNSLEDLFECADSGGMVMFDLTTQDGEVQFGISTNEPIYSINNVNLSRSEAANYTTTDASTLVTVTLTNSSGCEYISDFYVNAEVNGAILEDNYEYSFCDRGQGAANDGYEGVNFDDIIEDEFIGFSADELDFYTASDQLIDKEVTYLATTESLRVVYTSSGVAGCTDESVLNLIVTQPPVLGSGFSLGFLEICDVGHDSEDRDTLATFDMSGKKAELIAELDTQGNTGYTIEFYPSIFTAENQFDQIDDIEISNYKNDENYTNSLTQTIGVRISNGSGCVTYAAIELRPRYLISNTAYTDVEQCELTDFDLSEKKEEIAAGNNYEISIYESYSNLIMNSNALTDVQLENYPIDNQLTEVDGQIIQTLWVSVEDLDAENLGCSDFDQDYDNDGAPDEGFATFQLIVNTRPEINQLTNNILDPICDSGTDGVIDGFVSLFNDRIAEELKGGNDIEIFYFYSEPDPLTVERSEAIDNDYENVPSDSPLEFWALGFGDTGCFSDPVSFFIQVNASPLVDNETPDVVYVCYDKTTGVIETPYDENNTDVIVDQTGVTITYHETLESATYDADQGELPAAQITAPVFYDSNRSIWYRIQNDVTGCFSTVEQEIVVNVIPVIKSLEDFDLCVDQGESTAGFLLSSKDAEIIGDQTDVEVKYYTSESLAEAGDANTEISKTTLFDASNGTIVYVRVENTDDSNCYNENAIESFLLKVSEYTDTGALTLGYVATPECDDDSSDDIYTADFDLQEIIDIITNNGAITDLTIEFYTDADDAGFDDVEPSGTGYRDPVPGTAIIDEDNDDNNGAFLYRSEGLSQGIVVRITNDAGCVTFQEFLIVVRELPIIKDITAPIEVCDVDNDNTEEINLTEIENLSTLDFSEMTVPVTDLDEVTITYFTSQQGAEAFAFDETSTLDKIEDPTIPHTLTQVGVTEIFISIKTNTTQCSYETSFNAVLNKLPEITPVNVEACEDNLGSETFTIDLLTLNDVYLFYKEADPNVVLTYYSDPSGGATNVISGSYTKNAGTNSIYLEATNNTTGCQSSEIIEIPLIAKPLPETTMPTVAETTICEGDSVNDGTTEFSLNSLDSIILNSQSTTDFSIQYYLTTDLTNELIGNYNVSNATSYTAVITNLESNCSNSLPFNIIVNQLPEIGALTTLEHCDDDEVLNNTTTVDLTEVIGQFSYVTSVEAKAFSNDANSGVMFYTDALRTNKIFDPVNYLKVGNIGQTIYLSLISIDGCVYETNFNLQINAKPVIDTENNSVFYFCETDFGNGTYTIDLESEITTTLINSASSYTISYHTDAAGTSAEIGSPFTTGDTIIYIKAVDGNCENIEEVVIDITALPTVNSVPTNLSSTCDDDGTNDGITVFDFSRLTSSILGSQDPLVYSVSYHETLQNAEDDLTINQNNISTNNYYVKVINRNTSCFSIDELMITVNTVPNISQEDIYFCVNDPDRIIDKYTGNDDDTYLWSFDSARANETTSAIILSVADVNTNVTLEVENAVTGCVDDFTFFIEESPSPVINPIVEKYFDTDEVIIGVSEPGNYLYALTKTKEVPDSSDPGVQESNVFTEVLPGRFYAHVIDLNGCGDVEPVEVIFIDYYPFFTPNGEGPEVTETWHIQEIVEIPDTVVYIYNRYGVLMTTLTAESPGWDGNYKGQPMPTDDYWILIDLVDEESVKDHITLKR